VGVASSTGRASGRMFFSFSEVVGMQKFGSGGGGGGAFASASDAQLVWGLAVLPVSCLAVVVGMPVSSGGGTAIFAGGFEFARGTRFRCKFGDDFSRSALSSRRWGSVGGGFVSVAGALFALGPAGSLAAVSRRCLARHGRGIGVEFACRFSFSLSFLSPLCSGCDVLQGRVFCRGFDGWATSSVPPSAVAPSASAPQVFS